MAIYDVRGAALSAAASGAVTLRYTESGSGGGSGTAAKQALQDSQLWRVRPATTPGADWCVRQGYIQPSTRDASTPHMSDRVPPFLQVHGYKLCVW